jgi:hypothetical protein
MNTTDAQETDSVINLREVILGDLHIEQGPDFVHKSTEDHEFDPDGSDNIIDLSNNSSVSAISEDNVFSSVETDDPRQHTDRKYDIIGSEMYGIKISPKIIDGMLPEQSFRTPPDHSFRTPSTTRMISQTPLHSTPLDVFSNARTSTREPRPSMTSVMQSSPELSQNNISNIMHMHMHSDYTEELLNKCGIYNTDPTLKSLVNNMIKFVRTSFADYSTYCNNKLVKKYKTSIENIVGDLNRVMNLLVINGQDQKLENIVLVYNETKGLLTKLALKEDNTYDYLVKKITDVIRINQNIIIITSLWRKNLDINLVIQSGIDIFHAIIDNVILPLKDDLTDTGMNAMVYEPRILTDSGSVAPSHTPLHSQPSSPVIKYMPSADTNPNSIRTATIKRSTSVEHTPSRKHDTDDEPYIGDFTSKKPMSFDQLNTAINASYGNTDTLESSTAIDILSMYLKGQKILYTEGKNYCERYLNMLMIPAIVIVSVAGLMAQVWTNSTGRLVISILTAINILLLTLISYLKLDAKAEAHKTSATNYGLLEMKCQFLSGKIMYVDTDVKLNTIIDEIEKKVIETKTANQFVLPDYVIAAYPEIYNTNVFAKVKIMFITEIVMRNDLKNTVNKLHFMSRVPNKTPAIQKDLQELELLQDIQLNHIIEYKKNYLLLDQPFTEEIERNVVLKKARWYCCFGLFNKLTCGFCYRTFFWVTNSNVCPRKPSFGDLSLMPTSTLRKTDETELPV